MSLPRDVLLFSIVVMLWAVQIEASGYGSSDRIVVIALGGAAVGLLGSILSALRAADRSAETDSGE